MSFVTRDSGERQEFTTGSRRDSRDGKGRFDLIPTMPLRRLAGLYERGAVKYGDYNWQKGQPLMRYIDSAQRHLNALVAGEPTEDHAIAVVWNMFSYVWTLDQLENHLMPIELDDRPAPEPEHRFRHIDWCSSSGPFNAPDCDCPGSNMDKAYEANALAKRPVSLAEAVAMAGFEDPEAAIDAVASSLRVDAGSAFEAANEYVSPTEDCPPQGAAGCGGPGDPCGIHNPVMGAC